MLPTCSSKLEPFSVHNFHFCCSFELDNLHVMKISTKKKNLEIIENF